MPGQHNLLPGYHTSKYYSSLPGSVNLHVAIPSTEFRFCLSFPFMTIAKLFHFCHLSKLVRPETYGPYQVLAILQGQDADMLHCSWRQLADDCLLVPSEVKMTVEDESWQDSAAAIEWLPTVAL